MASSTSRLHLCLKDHRVLCNSVKRRRRVLVTVAQDAARETNSSTLRKTSIPSPPTEYVQDNVPVSDAQTSGGSCRIDIPNASFLGITIGGWVDPCKQPIDFELDGSVEGIGFTLRPGNLCTRRIVEIKVCVELPKIDNGQTCLTIAVERPDPTWNNPSHRKTDRHYLVCFNI